MWTRFLLKPWWARALTTAGVFAVVVAAGWCAHGLAAYPHRSWLSALALRVAGLVILGLLLAAFTIKSHRAYTNAVAGLDPGQRSAAIDASVRGPVPADVPVRGGAIQIAGVRRESSRRWRVWLTVLSSLVALNLVLGTWLVGSKVGDWTELVVVLGFAAGAWYLSLSAERRLQTLSQAVDSDR